MKVELNQKCTSLYQAEPVQTTMDNVNLEEAVEFANGIRRNTGYKVFHSSVCNIANSSEYGCKVKLYRYNKALCYDCSIDNTTIESIKGK